MARAAGEGAREAVISIVRQLDFKKYVACRFSKYVLGDFSKYCTFGTFLGSITYYETCNLTLSRCGRLKGPRWLHRETSKVACRQCHVAASRLLLS